MTLRQHITICFLCFAFFTNAEARSFFSRFAEGWAKFFMSCDTTYITPQKYNITIQSELSYWHDYYNIRSSETGKRMVIESEPSMVLGGYVFYSILGFGLSWNLNDIGKPNGQTNGTSIRKGFSLHTARLFAEVFTYSSGKTARITHLSDFDFKDRDRSFSGLDSKVFGVHAFYIFNNRKFSWPAAFGENAVQRKSCGSWTLGFQYNKQDITLNDKELPDYLVNKVDQSLLFRKVNYSDYSISVGYAFNWVIGRNLLLAIAAQPSIGYRRSNIEGSDFSHNILNNVSTDLTTRASFFWNNTHLFSGLILELHTYSYRQNTFGLTNTYGTLKFVFGFNCWRKH